MTYYRRHSTKVMKSAIKALDRDTVVKSIANLRKSLIECDRQAKLAFDDIEDIKYGNAVAMDEAAELVEPIEETIKAIDEASYYITKALEVTSNAKQIIQGRKKVRQEQPAKRYRPYRRY